VVTHQLPVERGTRKVRRPETDVLPLCHATNLNEDEYIIYYAYTSVQSVITFDKLGRYFVFVYSYACLLLRFLCCYRFSVNKDDRIECRRRQMSEAGNVRSLAAGAVGGRRTGGGYYARVSGQVD